MCNGFTKIDNSIIESENLSFDAKGIYMVISRYISIPGFKINKSHIKSVTGLGPIRFNRAWKELKEKGLLIQVKKSINGKFVYEYSLKTQGVKATPVEENKPTHIDSNGNAPIEGQIDIDEIIEPSIEKDVVTNETTTDETIVSKETGFDTKQSKELLKIAGNNILKIIQAYKYTMQQNNVKNLFKYTLWCIKNNIASKESKPKSAFNDFSQRKYNFEELERRLLGIKSNNSLYQEG
ncbi:hypothetical protein ACER0A_002315 [Haloimpatiens sp. FM7315]|uniref:hypothetical protein n=1 Tax=Haloimpatiens sp. FM7315 TaxID=3298609 RepID=UPI0035A31534